MVKWLKVGGYIFFRESCFHQSGDSKRKYNPTHYREPRFYTKVWLSYSLTKHAHESGLEFCLRVLCIDCLTCGVLEKKRLIFSVCCEIIFIFFGSGVIVFMPSIFQVKSFFFFFYYYLYLHWFCRFLRNAKHVTSLETLLNCLLLAANALELMCETRRIKIRWKTLV